MKRDVDAPLFSGPFALGTLSAPDGIPFPALVTPDGSALDLRAALGEHELTIRALLERWDEAAPRLQTLARDDQAAWRPLADLRVHAPLEPRQVFQSGANYRQHVIDLEVAHRDPDDPRTDEQARAEMAEIMDRRAAEDLPYVFIGLPSAITGPYDDVVLPSWAEKPDWELELVAVIGKPAYRVSTGEALEYVAGYTIANDLTDRATVFRRDMPAIGTDWLRSKNAPGFTPLGPWIVPTESIADSGDLRVTLKLNGEAKEYSPLSRVLELEGLRSGVEAKLQMWLALQEIRDQDERLQSAPLDDLIARARSQSERLEPHRRAAARTAFG